MAQIVTRLNVIGSPLVNSLKGESLPCAIPNRCVGYGFDQKLGGRSCSPSPPRSGTARSFMTETAPELDHYATLGVSRGASKREIKSAYRRLVLQYHPDTNRGESSTVKMMRITDAYERAMAALPPLADDVGIGGDEYVEGCYGVGDESWEEWEEWMGWEGAGTYDYSNHM